MMKRIMILTIMFFSFIFSQSRYITGGLTYSNIISEQETIAPNEAISGISLGIEKRNIASKLISGMTFTQRGRKYTLGTYQETNYTNEDVDSTSGTYTNDTTTERISYLTFYAQKSFFLMPTLQFNLGGEAGYYLTHGITHKDSNGTEFGLSEDDTKWDELGNGKFDYGLLFDVRYYLMNYRMYLGAGYYIGLANVNTSEKADSNKHSGFKFSFGYRI